MWQCFKTTFLSPKHLSGNEALQKTYSTNGCSTTGYVCRAIGKGMQKEALSPIGGLLSGMFSRLAWTFPDMRQLADYFSRVNLGGGGEGRMRQWPIDIYSEGIR